MKKDIKMTWSDIANFLEHNLEMSRQWIQKCADPLFASVIGRPAINICIFDDWLHEKYGDYENKNLGMGDIIKEKYPEYENTIRYILGLCG